MYSSCTDDQSNSPETLLVPWKGYTHCLIKGPMSFPDTLEMDLRNQDVDRSIWLHMCDWYFCDDAVLARLNNLLNT